MDFTGDDTKLQNSLRMRGTINLNDAAASLTSLSLTWGMFKQFATSLPFFARGARASNVEFSWETRYLKDITYLLLSEERLRCSRVY